MCIRDRWYREQLEELQNANQKTAEELQQRAEEAERKLKETEQQLADAAGDAARAQELQKELEQAKKDLEACLLYTALGTDGRGVSVQAVKKRGICHSENEKRWRRVTNLCLRGHVPRKHTL